MKEIRLTRGKTVLVDDEDYVWLNQWKWCAEKGKRTFYACRTSYIGGKHTIRMHQLILNVSKPLVSDHKDGDGLNCQKDNLRVCTNQQNCCGKKPAIGGSSVFKGVDWDKQKKRWRVRIGVNGKQRGVGFFKSEIKAAVSYNNAALKYHGEFARLNTIPQIGEQSWPKA